jgi:hypothetical protein
MHAPYPCSYGAQGAEGADKVRPDIGWWRARGREWRELTVRRQR